VKNAPNFEMYRIPRISYKILALTNASYQQGVSPLELPFYYKVPIMDGRVPAVAETAYLGFQNLEYQALSGPLTGSFAPNTNVSSISTNT